MSQITSVRISLCIFSISIFYLTPALSPSPSFSSSLPLHPPIKQCDNISYSLKLFCYMTAGRIVAAPWLTKRKSSLIGSGWFLSEFVCLWSHKRHTTHTHRTHTLSWYASSLHSIRKTASLWSQCLSHTLTHTLTHGRRFKWQDLSCY